MVKRPKTSVALALALCILAPAAVRAENPDAKAAFERGKKYFELEEYKAAVRQFKLAYQLSGQRPSTILALAQCERQLGRYADAVEHFREYLATNPEDAAEVRETIVLLDELTKEEAAEKKRAADLAAQSPPPAEDGGSIITNPYLWIAVGVVVAGGATVGGLGIAGVFSGTEDPYGGTSGVIIGQ